MNTYSSFIKVLAVLKTYIDIDFNNGVHLII